MCDTHAQHGCVHVMCDHMTHPYVWAWHMDESCEIWKSPDVSMDATHPSWACALSIQGQTRWDSKYTKEVMLMAWLWVALHDSSIRVKGLIRVCDMTTSWLIHMFERRLWSHVIYDDQTIKRHVRFFLYGSLEKFFNKFGGRRKTPAQIDRHTYTNTRTHARAQTREHTHIRARTHVFTHANKHHTYVHTCTCTHTRTYAHVQMNTSTRTHT
jgi:hypothetical protein